MKPWGLLLSGANLKEKEFVFTSSCRHEQNVTVSPQTHCWKTRYAQWVVHRVYVKMLHCILGKTEFAYAFVAVMTAANELKSSPALKFLRSISKSPDYNFLFSSKNGK